MPPSTVDGAKAPSRLPTLTGMRFLAALSVFFFHVTFQFLFASQPAQGNFFSIFGFGGFVGVSFFFILSGFVLTWSVRGSISTGRFWRRRLVKIFPNHIVTFVAAIGLLTWITYAPINNRHAVLNFFLLQSWFPDFPIRGSLNSVAWTLSCELLFYLAFPALYVVVSRIRPERLWAAAGVVAGAVLLVPLAAKLLPVNTFIPGSTLTFNEHWFIYQLPPVRMLEFILGMLLARIVLTGRRLPIGLGGAVAVTLAAQLVTPVLPVQYQLVAVSVIPLALVVAAGAKVDLEGRHGWLASRTMVRLGDWSFAFYLWHWMVIVGISTQLGVGRQFSTPVVFALIALFLAVTLVLSGLLFTLVERPMMRYVATSRRERAAAKAPVLTPVATVTDGTEDRQPPVREAGAA
jgi:peptidoglycan/LPS O-acetylase OafA/YrhL